MAGESIDRMARGLEAGFGIAGKVPIVGRHIAALIDSEGRADDLILEEGVKAIGEKVEELRVEETIGTPWQIAGTRDQLRQLTAEVWASEGEALLDGSSEPLNVQLPDGVSAPEFAKYLDPGQ